MKINNIHRRKLATSPEKVGELIDSLASYNDQLWPHETWPAMKFDRPLQVGAKGGHGPFAIGWSTTSRACGFNFVSIVRLDSMERTAFTCCLMSMTAPFWNIGSQ